MAVSQGFQETVVRARGEHRVVYFFCKRVLDVVLATLLLMLLLPVMLLIAVLIQLDSAGPVIFVQKRVGGRRRSGPGAIWEIRTFPFYKFRSMVKDADPALHKEYIQAFVEGRTKKSEADEAKFKLTGDSRITRVGRLLRRASLDELPQLLNVIKGDMSLVGPRPVPIYEVAQYQDSHSERLASLAGMTGLWQVKGRCQVPFEEMIRMDIEYVRHQSLWLDLKILWFTLPAVLSGRGAE